MDCVKGMRGSGDEVFGQDRQKVTCCVRKKTRVAVEETRGMLPATTAAALPSVHEALLSAAPLDLVKRRDIIVAHLVSADPHVAVSVWSPRSFPSARGTALLRAYTEEFLHLLGVEHPVVMTEACLTMLPIDPNDHLKVSSVLEETMHVIEEMHNARLQGASGVTLHVSFTGHVRYMYTTILALFDEHGVLLEWIIGMSPIAILLPPQRIGLHQVRRSTSSSSSSLSSVSDSETSGRIDSLNSASIIHHFRVQHRPSQQEWIQVSKQELERKSPKNEKTSSFRCTKCGVTSTPQRRCVSQRWPFFFSFLTCILRAGPKGPGTLCNGCGIKWARQTHRNSL